MKNSLKKTVKDEIEVYIEKHKILLKYQSGFQKKHSYETALHFVIDRWKNMNKNNKILVFFFHILKGHLKQSIMIFYWENCIITVYKALNWNGSNHT